MFSVIWMLDILNRYTILHNSLLRCADVMDKLSMKIVFKRKWKIFCVTNRCALQELLNEFLDKKGDVD